MVSFFKLACLAMASSRSAYQVMGFLSHGGQLKHLYQTMIILLDNCVPLVHCNPEVIEYLIDLQNYLFNWKNINDIDLFKPAIRPVTTPAQTYPNLCVEKIVRKLICREWF